MRHRTPGWVDAILATLFLLFDLTTGSSQDAATLLASVGMIVAGYLRRTCQLVTFGICAVCAVCVLGAVALVRDQNAPIAVADLRALIFRAVTRYAQDAWLRRAQFNQQELASLVERY